MYSDRFGSMLRQEDFEKNTFGLVNFVEFLGILFQAKFLILSVDW